MKPTTPTKRSQINVCVADSNWEITTAKILDAHPKVKAWAKNDHLGFEIPYLHDGVKHLYRPDFLVRLANGEHLVLEVKGIEDDKAKSKRFAMERWAKAVSDDSRFGKWHCQVSYEAQGAKEILAAF